MRVHAIETFDVYLDFNFQFIIRKYMVDSYVDVKLPFHFPELANITNLTNMQHDSIIYLCPGRYKKKFLQL